VRIADQVGAFVADARHQMLERTRRPSAPSSIQVVPEFVGDPADHLGRCSTTMTSRVWAPPRGLASSR
jgi:hypothetical protein